MLERAHLRLRPGELTPGGLLSRSLSHFNKTIPVLVVVPLTGDRITAYVDSCPHGGLPLSGGELSSGFIVCPHHGWSFDEATGQAKNLSTVKLRALPIARDGDDFLVFAPSP